MSLGSNKGFTLIELLVVVAIIGVLAAVGVVAFNGFMESAKKRATVANFKNASHRVFFRGSGMYYPINFFWF